MRLLEVIWAYGTAEGDQKAWDTRGRKNPDDSEHCIGPECRQLEHKLDQKEIPHVDQIEFEMRSDKGNANIHFDKDAMRTMLKAALKQLDSEDARTNYLNTPDGNDSKNDGTDHFVTLRFQRNSEGVERP